MDKQNKTAVILFGVIITIFGGAFIYGVKTMIDEDKEFVKAQTQETVATVQQNPKYKILLTTESGITYYYDQNGSLVFLPAPKEEIAN